jgi:pyrimidine operon attenuation protein/uracil phosphoribosyltransferase
MPGSKTLILNSRQIRQRIDRIAYQVYEQNYLEKEIIVAGIAKNGFVLAERIAEKITEISPIKVTLAEITISKKNPLSEKVKVNLPEKELKGNVIVIVDDVLETGRTLVFAMDPFLKYPVKRLTTVVLVDRDHHSYPVKADFVGISLATTMQEHISVELAPSKSGTASAKNDAVYLL